MAVIVIAEDDQHIRRVLEMWLKKNNHEVYAAENGQIACGLVAEKRPSILITDVNMPVMSGVELVRYAKEELGDALGALVLTSRCDRETVTEQIATEGVQVLAKPFSPTRVLSYINEMLESIPAAVRS